MVSEQVHYEDTKEGDEIPTLTVNCDSQRLVMWAAATGDFYPIHFDKDFAQATGLPDRIVHGALKHALLGRLLQQWAGGGQVIRVACQYRGMDMVDQDINCKGIISKKYRRNDENIVELEVWTETPQGEKTTLGQGVVVLPSREG